MQRPDPPHRRQFRHQWEGNGLEAALLCECERTLHTIAYGYLGGTPEHVDPRDVDDCLVGQSSSTRENSPAKWDWPLAAQLPEGGVAGSTLDGAGYTLRQKQPPGNDIAVPGVDDGFDFLAEEVAIDEFQVHGATQQPNGSAFGGQQQR